MAVTYIDILTQDAHIAHHVHIITIKHVTVKGIMMVHTLDVLPAVLLNIKPPHVLQQKIQDVLTALSAHLMNISQEHVIQLRIQYARYALHLRLVILGQQIVVTIKMQDSQDVLHVLQDIIPNQNVKQQRIQYALNALNLRLITIRQQIVLTIKMQNTKGVLHVKKGYYMKTKCKARKDAVCKECKCDKNAVKVKECTASAPPVCVCATNMYLENAHTCKACKRCNKGYYRSEGCDGKVNSVCKKCRSSCPKGYLKTAECWYDKDTQCRPQESLLSLDDSQ